MPTLYIQRLTRAKTTSPSWMTNALKNEIMAKPMSTGKIERAREKKLILTMAQQATRNTAIPQRTQMFENENTQITKTTNAKILARASHLCNMLFRRTYCPAFIFFPDPINAINYFSYVCLTKVHLLRGLKAKAKIYA